VAGGKIEFKVRRICRYPLYWKNILEKGIGVFWFLVQLLWNVSDASTHLEENRRITCGYKHNSAWVTSAAVK